MKKTTYLNQNQSTWKRLMSLVAVMVVLTVQVMTQNVLLGEYEFTTGPDQDKATNVMSGLTFSGALEYTTLSPDRITAVYENNTVVTSGWLATSQNISQGRCVQFTINKDVTLASYEVSKVVILYKILPEDETSGKKTFNVAETVNNGRYRIWDVKVVPYSGPEFDTLNIEADANPYPVVTDNNPRYFVYAPQSGGPVTIDKIEVWGTVVQATEPSVTTDITSKDLIASHQYPSTFPVTLSGLFIDETTTLSFTGTDNAKFSVDKTSLSVEELNEQEVTVHVTYDASTLTYDPVTKINTPHEAVLQIANPGVDNIEIPITASCYVLYEDFTVYDDLIGVVNELSALTQVQASEIQTNAPGWTGDYLYKFRTGSTGGAICLGSLSTDSAYFITPELDLSQPYYLTFRYRSLTEVGDGRLFVYSDDDDLIFSGIRTSWSIIKATTEPFVGTAASKIKFTGIKHDDNQMVIDDIEVNYLTDPTLHVFLNQKADFGVVTPGGQKSINIPLKGYNLTEDVTLSLTNGADFSLLTSATVDQTTAGAGTSIDVQFTAPAIAGDYQDTLTLSTSDFSRDIILLATADSETGLSDLQKGRVKILPHGIELTGYQGKDVKIFAVTGMEIIARSDISSNEFIGIDTSGIYVLKIEDEHTRVSKKIIMQ